MKKKIIIGVSVLIIGVVGFWGYQFYQFTEFLDDKGECGMSVGPIYGDTLNPNKINLDFEQTIEIPNGKFGLMNLMDTLAPKLVKFDKNDNLIWAVEFKEDSTIGIPYQKLSKMDLIKDEYGVRLAFFNHSYSEPGKIYLTDNYELEHMCLSPF